MSVRFAFLYFFFPSSLAVWRSEIEGAALAAFFGLVFFARQGAIYNEEESQLDGSLNETLGQMEPV